MFLTTTANTPRNDGVIVVVIDIITDAGRRLYSVGGAFNRFCEYVLSLSPSGSFCLSVCVSVL